MTQHRWGALATVFMIALMIWGAVAESSVHIVWLRLPMEIVLSIATLTCVYRYLEVAK